MNHNEGPAQSGMPAKDTAAGMAIVLLLIVSIAAVASLYI